MTTAAASLDQPAHDRLALFPVSFFAVVMGFAGLTIASYRMELAAGLSHVASQGLFWTSLALYAVIGVTYLAKALLRSRALASEWAHPVRISFFPAMSIGLILLGTAGFRIDQQFSFVLWAIGTAAHLVFTVLVMTAWINHTRYEVIHLNPAWFIPVVGNILVPVVGVHHAHVDISWFFFSIGLVFWLVLLTIVVNRLIFHNPLPARLMPTLFILIAPPAVGFLSCLALTADLGPFARILFFTGLFTALLMLPQVGRLARLPFTLSWWAYSFPLAALTIANFAMAEHAHLSVYRWIGFGLYVILAGVIALLVVRTITAMLRGEICVPEH